ncbi:thymidine kinase [Paraphotobacterium marinum]|uniref:Thymidine kinase n=1 Tax=Paraphotobacterium marinum TaxID=1755811 RepID=A0A220VDX9_9GAMM|nr:thymidine kinase [Paraphotobacterium marinum]ASK78559.1 thymidine kinase [Paraphotobacterium marinum]
MAQLYFYYSTMNAGKSTNLLQASFNYKERGLNSLIYTAKIDTRFGESKVSSRIGLSEKAFTFDKNTDFYKSISEKDFKLDCLLIDESQFLTKSQVLQLSNVVDMLDIPVLCYGLRTDFQGELFEGSQYLLAWSDKLVELKTICFCGRKANMVLRQTEDGTPIREGSQIDIGGNEKYISLCRKHYREAFRKS